MSSVPSSTRLNAARASAIRPTAHRPGLSRKQSGFTLVEIAIVLVIIGLLLGGILKGQELINSARVRNLADTTTGIQAAYYGFIDRYRRVPGDLELGSGDISHWHQHQFWW